MTNLLSAGELEEIRKRDAACGPSECVCQQEFDDRRRLLAHIEAMETLMHKAVETLNAIEGLKIVNKVDATGEEFPGSWQQYSTWKSELAREALRQIGPLP